MQLHIAIPNFGTGSTPQAIAEIAEEAEALGFDGVGTTDHLMVPLGQPQRYERVFEALTVLAYLAARTRRVKLITTVVVLLMRNPFVLAKQAATIDQLSCGRLVLGLGVGWSEPEFANIHADFQNRGAGSTRRSAFSGISSPAPERRSRAATTDSRTPCSIPSR